MVENGFHFWKLIDNRLCYSTNQIAEFTFQPSMELGQVFACGNLEIYQKPEWYESIPEGGVLCWCCDEEDAPTLDIIVHYDAAASYTHEGKRTIWKNATPLTDSEIENFKRGF